MERAARRCVADFPGRRPADTAEQREYGVPREALEFFYAHAVDIDHGQVGEDIVLTRVETPEAQRAIWLHQKKGQAKQWINYDAYYQVAIQAGAN